MASRIFAGQAGGLPVSLFFAGLAGSLSIASACAARSSWARSCPTPNGIAAASYGEWRRLAGAALAPYHLGRLTTYTALGAVAGTATALFASTAIFAWLAAALLVVAAGLMVLQAFGLAASARSPLAPVLTRLAGPLSTSHSPAARYALGVVLGFLPAACCTARSRPRPAPPRRARARSPWRRSPWAPSRR